MNIFEQSFGKSDPFQKTAQFFNPDKSKLRQPFLKRRRENSLPQQNLEAIKSILQKTNLLQKNYQSRKPTIHISKDANKENIYTRVSTKQSTQQSAQDSYENQSNIPLIMDMKHSISSCITQNYRSCVHNKQNNSKDYSTQCSKEIENNSKLSKMTQSQEKKRQIKVKDPYGLLQKITNVPTKNSSKSFIHQKAQIKLVDRIFSSRSDSVQG